MSFSLEGIKPGIETVYRFNIEGGPVVAGTGGRERIRITQIVVEVGEEGDPYVTVQGRKLLKDGSEDTRTRALFPVDYGIVVKYEQAFETWKNGRGKA